MTQIWRPSVNPSNMQRAAIVWRACGRRVAFQLAIALIAVTGCSGDSNRPTSDGMMEDVAQAVQTASPAPHPVQTTSSKNVITPDVFAGMWDYDEGDPFPDAQLQGLLLIEGPCVYVVDDYAWNLLLPGRPPKEEELPDPVRVFVSLPRAQTSYDPESETIWVGDQGPMTSGDRVTAGGGGFDRVPPDACSVDDDGVFIANVMGPKLCDRRFKPDHRSQIGCKPNDPDDPLAGMWSYDPANPHYAPAAEGVLLIEGPCVFVVDDFMWLVPGVPLEDLPEPVRVFVNLPRAQTRYDPDTETIWVHDQGPMASGDRVQMAGGADRSVPDACSAGVDRVFTATHMSPKQCAPWVPPERQTGCKAPEADRPSDEAGTKWTGTKWEEP